jgi:UDP-N-acetylglucosamine--N-acetylmuramyl-(pentapeptide) pyrophosphoryl-undecaprenol N-acetylglucosamine transferase
VLVRVFRNKNRKQQLVKPKKQIRIIISGGGTGGHIFPAISIADELKRRDRDMDILFVGAIGRMEMERVPAAGYEIKGLPVIGFQRKLTINNLKVLFSAWRSLKIAKRILIDFNPVLAIGVGGYASGPLLRSASKMGIPTLLQEQNSYAGVTNKLLAKRANIICVAYTNMERYFPANKIVITGNPVRDIKISDALRNEGIKHFGLSKSKPVILVVGGSLGARTINLAMLKNIDKLVDASVQVIWQTGKIYHSALLEQLTNKDLSNIRIHDFISRMDLAYNVADVMISRAGAISISEICLTGRAAVLVPSPNVAEDHQTKNAMALVNNKAAVLVKDNEAEEKLIPRVLEIIEDTALVKQLAGNCLKLAKPDSTAHIVDEVYKLLEKE